MTNILIKTPYQKENSNVDDVINVPIHIPEKLATNPPQLSIKYRQAPDIRLRPIKFEKTQYQCENKPLTYYSKTWALSSYAANQVNENDEVNTSHEMADLNEPIVT